MGNKCDMEESKRKVPYSQGQALADEFGIQFFETSAKNNIKVDEVSSHHVCLTNPSSNFSHSVCFHLTLSTCYHKLLRRVCTADAARHTGSGL